MKFAIPAHTLEKQRRASSPEVSAWVSAHAGSGKTHVLTQRVVRLLLSGVRPSRLICLTFTKAAAANMSARVFAMLARWTLMDDDALTKEIEAVGATPPRDLDSARQLFAAAVETPGGLKIQTIHAFCERVLHLFPFEANVPAEFRAAEDLERTDLLALAQRQTFEAAAGEPALGAALTHVAQESSEFAFGRILAAALENRATLEDAEGAIARLPQALGLAANEDAASVRRAMISDGAVLGEWRAIADVFASSSKTDKEQGKRLASAAALAPDPACLGAYLTFFFTDNGAGGMRKRLGTGAIEKEAPGLLDMLRAEALRLDALREKLRALAVRDRSAALLRVAARCLKQYDELKRIRGVLDFDDMIERTCALFTREGAAAWALYKLDSGIDHILVDEAQDTSQTQWRILEALAGEFMAGHGARTNRRTFFAVGDEKQSIFSFQGASPESFGRMRNEFDRRAREADLPFDGVRLDMSFRSAKTILDAVDLVFGRPEALRGLSSDAAEPPPTHQALKQDLVGMVDIWEPVVGEKADDPEDWRPPLDMPRESAPPVQLARRIAQKIGSLTAPGSRERVRDSRSGELRPVRPGDVMILVRRRDAFFEAMTRALKAAGVPVAGADRLEVASHIAVMDLSAAARAALAPDDDYSLACALKSPLVGLDDDDLIALVQLGAASLDGALRASSGASHAAAAQKIARWRQWAQESRPFDFFSRLLGPDGGRRAFRARLGTEAGDALDEFMGLALEHERSEAPSLAAFVHEIEALQLNLKRDMEGAEDVVRVMTVHAAKGLEAKIVFLPDTCRLPPAAGEAGLFALDTPAGATLAWSPHGADDPAPVAESRSARRAETENEYRRLLYVALTRAEERLYVCGHHGARGRQEGCWYDLVAAGLDHALNQVEDECAPGGQARRFGEACVEDGRAGEIGASVAEVAAIGAPDWLFAAARPEMEPPPPLRPSNALAGADRFEPSEIAADAGQGHGARRGLLVHRMMQNLANLPAEKRQEAAHRFFRAQSHRNASDADQAAAQALAQEIVQALALAPAAPLFGPSSRAEIAIAASIEREGRRPLEIAGRIDRLAEVGAEVWIADFKTGAPHNEIPAAYVRQLALYRAAVGQIYSGRPVRAFVLWTQAPRLAEVPAEAMTAALAAL
ncbi:MAG: double-strand break repair helicase AddA [Rhodoblastus sp.]